MRKSKLSKRALLVVRPRESRAGVRRLLELLFEYFLPFMRRRDYVLTCNLRNKNNTAHFVSKTEK